jgi:Bacterial pre-peptidase C-terminal domain
MRVSSVLIILIGVIPTQADLPSPRLDRITPMGGAAGSTVEVEITGNDLEEATTLNFDHAGLKSEHLKERKFKVTIAANVPAGTYDARVIGRYGVSSPRLFQVSHSLAEVVEKEPNDDAATAQPIDVNAIVNGTSDNNREDCYRFTLKQGQRVVVECQAQKLDSQLDATLTLTDAAGKQLAANGDWFGLDPLIDYIAPKDGDYIVSVCDLTFRGGFPYRLLVTDRPHVENVFPRALQIGKPTPLSIYGRNLGGKAKPSNWTIGELRLDEDSAMEAAPTGLLNLGAYRFSDHPTTHSVLPTAATCTLTGFTLRGVPVLLSEDAVTLESEPNDDPKKPQILTLPAVVSGRFDKERDADWYEIEAKEDGAYAFDVYCERIGGRADPYLVVLDDKDARVSELDDFGARVNAFDGHLRDPSGSVNLAKNRKYRVLVQDRYRRGGARYQYVLTIRKPQPDFYPAVIHSQNPGPAGTTIRKGGAAYLDVVIHNKEGFGGPLTISAEGLPKGLHALPTKINNDTRGIVVLWADSDAPDFVGPITLVATGKRGETEIKREVRPYTRVWTIANAASSRPTRELVVAIRETAPYALKFSTDRIEIEAGKKVDLKVQAERLWPDFKGSVNVIPLSFPGPIKMGAFTIAEGKNEGTATIEVQNSARTGEYTIAVMGQAQVPFSKDAKATTRPNTLVQQPSRPITVVVLPSMKK